jgi:hypothetical protein
MATGPGKYDHVATIARAVAGDADGVLVIVVGGNRGSGFSVQAIPTAALELPKLLRFIADQIEADTGGEAS